MSSHWHEYRLGDVCEIASELVDPKDAAYCHLPHVGGANMQSGLDALIDVRSALEEKLISGKFTFNQYDILYSKIRPYLRKVARPRFSGLCSADVYPLTPIDNLICRDYLYYLLISEAFTAYAEKGSARSGMPKVNREHLFGYIFRLPPLDEQQRIVAILDEAFQQLATAMSNAERCKASAAEFLESQRERTILTPSADWNRCVLGEICVVDWGNTDLTKSSYIEGGEFLAVSAAGCDGRIRHGEHDAYVPVLSAIGARCGRMFLPKEPFTAIKNTITLTPKPGRVDGRYLFHLLSSIELPQRGAGQPFISKGDIQRFEVMLPPLEEQITTVEKIEMRSLETEELRNQYCRKLDALAELKRSLLARALSGDLTRERLAA